MRRTTRTVRIGNVIIGGDNPIAVQSMTNTLTEDTEATVKQILELEEAGCDIVRVTIPDKKSAAAIPEIKKNIHIPLIGDIHFDHELALLAVDNGIDKIRINPGNIGGKEKTAEVLRSCAKANIPVRIGVNSGSLEKDILKKYDKVTAQGMVESMSKYIGYCEEENFTNIVLSLKSSDVPLMVESYKKISSLYDYPLHLGVTEAGNIFSGSIKSSVGLGILLYEGIGDTVRVSLTGDVKKEVKAARIILRSLGHKINGVNIISCPTCGRTKVNLEKLVDRLEAELDGLRLNRRIDLAVMGCAVNGPGEAREADIGIAGGIGEFLLFRKGEIIRKIPEAEVLSVLLEEISLMSEQNEDN
ncbi:MAG: flavodoxin-dependent (E)-4-hydroxy-3-methylbut-2-enyl-diphosphate synthase [Candidatus Delongbacteria bacterium]|jgi:(E)-4-hydroxy-3-methylbut-2-enyl-diphosphate synthase|nr:flavodoxin-dependent (E)-4-hydroxy-3-methylbut-2-enyl-diphosphate synthase [Candidatus Delongbacteria bacterium]